MSAFLNMVNRQLTTKGDTDKKLRSYSSSSFFDANTPTKGPVKTYIDYDILSFEASYNNNEINETLIKSGDIKLYVSPTGLSVTPKVDDLIINSTEQWKIKHIKKYIINSSVVLYTLQIRK